MYLCSNAVLRHFAVAPPRPNFQTRNELCLPPPNISGSLRIMPFAWNPIQPKCSRCFGVPSWRWRDGLPSGIPNREQKTRFRPYWNLSRRSESDWRGIGTSARAAWKTCLNVRGLRLGHSLTVMIEENPFDRSSSSFTLDCLSCLMLLENESSCVSHSNEQIKQLLIMFRSVDSELTLLDNGLVQGGLT